MPTSAPTPWAVDGWRRHLGGHGAVDPDAVRATLVHGTIASAAAATARRVPDREALRIGGRAITHGQLDDQARRLSSWLLERGAGPGRTVLVAGGNSVEYVIGYLAALHAGAAVAPVNPMLTARELEVLVEDADPVASLAVGDALEQLRDLGGADTVLRLDGHGRGTVSDVVAGSPPAPVRSGHSSELAHLAFTSGTTGRPKPTPLSHGNVLASIRCVMQAWRWREDDVLVHGLPLQHGHGLSGVHAVLLSGCRGVVLPSFDPQALCDAFAAHRGTVLFSVPAMYERLLAWQGFGDADLSTLRLATTGSAALSPRTSDAVATVLGQRPLERYGCTETGYVLSNPYAPELRRAGFVGVPLPGADVAIVGPDGGPLGPGEDGEVVARGPQVFAGYAGGVGGDAFLPGGWFRTGDVGRLDQACGYVEITGRTKELIITGGLNVYPREVELVLESLPGVSAAAVVGVPSERWGEEVTAFVVPEASVELDHVGLAAGAAAALAAYKRPKTYRVVDALPRNHMGKVLRAELQRRAAAPVDGPD